MRLSCFLGLILCLAVPLESWSPGFHAACSWPCHSSSSHTKASIAKDSSCRSVQPLMRLAASHVPSKEDIFQQKEVVLCRGVGILATLLFFNPFPGVVAAATTVENKPAAVAKPADETTSKQRTAGGGPRKSTIQLTSPLVPLGDKCPSGFRIVVEGATAADPPRVICRPTSIDAATAGVRRTVSQASREATKAVEDKISRVREAERKADEERQKKRIARQDKSSKAKETKTGENEAKEGELSLDVQGDIVKKEKAKAFTTMEAAVKEAKTKYDDAAQRASKRTAEVRKTGQQKLTEQNQKDLERAVRETELKEQKDAERRAQKQATEKMLKAQEEEMIKQMEFGMEAPVTPTVPSQRTK